MLTLLDVSVLLPLSWPNHQFHHCAAAYMKQWQGRWATCAITQLGFIRLSSTPKVVGVTISPIDAQRLLHRMTSGPRHQYIEALGPPDGEILGAHFGRILGPRQTTDAYLVALAEREGAEFATFDTKLAALSASVHVLDPSMV
ncbi:MAG: VapC toxin family PIN domain ribonuclease [Acidobacteria bacterium]|nr:VapC toxin family PIN domain ribonuclease [Acidobacteriota bacterium]